MANKHGGKRAGAGAKPIGESAMKVVTVRLSEDDINFLSTIDPGNLSAALRKVVQTARDVQDECDLADHFQDAW